MVLFRLIVLCLFIGAPSISLATPDPVLQPVFSQVMPDLPIMPGLTEDTDSALIFDKPDGRIIETRAIGALAPHIIKNFYLRALPALGWTSSQPGHYTRGQEKLALTISSKDRISVLNISIQPIGTD